MPMRTLRTNNLYSSIVLVFLILWGTASFFVFSTFLNLGWVLLAVGLIAAYCAVTEQAGYFVLILITFYNSYFLYGLQSATELPLWLLLLILASVLGFTFFLLKQQFVSDNENSFLVLIFFLISMMEIYLSLSYWLINPLTKSLIMGVFSYLFAGYLANTHSDGVVDKKFYRYIYLAIIVLAALFFTVSWGQ